MTGCAEGRKVQSMNTVLASLFLELGLSAHAQVPTWNRFDINETVNPYGVVAIGFEHEFSRKFSARVYVRHESAITAYDYGTDSAGAAITWRPFQK